MQTMHLGIIRVFFYLPTDAQMNCLKNSLKIYIKIDIKTAPRCFGAVTQSSGSLYVQGGSNMTGTSAACLHTNQSRSYSNHLVYTQPHHHTPMYFNWLF